MLLQNICCVELSFTDVTVGLVFLVVFFEVFVETKSTAEFFFHKQHIDLECSWLKVKVTTEELNNIQNSEYF